MKSNKKVKIANLTIKKGETVRKVVYIDGKKHYALLKCTNIQEYKRCSTLDQKRKSKAELKAD